MSTVTARTTLTTVVDVLPPGVGQEIFLTWDKGEYYRLLQ